MVVKIICGTYGHRPNKNEPRVIRKDNESPAFELEDEEAKRIISLGIAKACNPQEAYEEDAMPQMTEDEIESWGLNEIRKLAKKHGLDSKGTKEELIRRLKEAFLKEDASDEDEEAVFTDEDEMPPQLEAQEPV